LKIEDGVLKLLYVGASFLAIFMIFWISVIPASWRIGNWPGWAEFLEAYLQEKVDKGTNITPISLVMKYDGQRAVQFLHTVPALIWATALPFQLHAGFRKNHKPVHRRMGYCFFSSALLMMIGFAIIEYRKLDFMNHDFPSVPYDEHKSGIGLGWVPHHLLFRGVALAYLLFAGLALRAIRGKDFVTHRQNVLRHIGMGLWVAPQRIYVGIMQGKTPERQKEIFTDGAHIGLAFTVISAEIAVWIYKRDVMRKAAAAEQTAEQMKVPLGAPPEEVVGDQAQVELVADTALSS